MILDLIGKALGTILGHIVVGALVAIGLVLGARIMGVEL